MKTGHLLALGSLVAVLLGAPAARATSAVNLTVEEHVLASGLRVRLAPDPHASDVTVLVRYDVGSSDDPSGKDGLAHLVEHLTFDGSLHVPRGDYYRLLARAGASNLNGQTGLDETSYFETLPPEGLALALWLESERMGFSMPHLDRAQLDHQRQLVGLEINEKVLDRSLGSVGGVEMSEVFPTWHPYHRDVDPRWLDSITVDDVRAFVRTWYTPRNAILSVAGCFEPQAALALAERYFADLPGQEPPVRRALPSRFRPRALRVDMGAGTPTDAVAMVWPTPALDEPGDAELDLAAAILTDSQGRLQRELLRAGWVTSVVSREVSNRRASTFSIGGSVAPGVNPEGAVGIIEHVVDALATQVTDEECARARAAWQDALIKRLEATLARASLLAQARSIVQPWSLGKYDGVGAAQVSAAVRRLLTPERRTVVVVRHGRYPAQGVVLGRKEPPP